ncbi:MAG: hypothetical protein L3J37_01995 [Rhodobacteraceae bacterium]|nr:hypothetical protein [Paracoccaceae bacterium]
MRWQVKLSRLLLGGVIVVATGIATAGFMTFERNLDAMKEASQENIVWSVTQLERELTRFRDALGASSAGQSRSTAEINQRFDILWSRVSIFQRGQVGERLREYDVESNTIGRLFQELKRQELAVVSITSYDFLSLEQISDAFYPFADELHDLSRRVTFGEEEKAAVVRAQMRSGADFALFASILTVVMIIAVLIYFVIEGRKFRKLAEQNMNMAEQFRLASVAKSRFLTMMSHELRTPMNGVLGLLAVAREAETEPGQRHLLDQADRSANRMLDMLTDILDFAALDNAQLALDDKPFSPNGLLSALLDILGPAVNQAGVGLRVVEQGELPVRLSGDESRLRRSYAMMITYFLETAGARDIELELGYREGRLEARIMVGYLNGGWSPDLLFGTREESEDSFASEVLGPAVARSLIERMGGKIWLEEPENERIILRIDVPLKTLEPRRLKVLLNVQSGPMEMICKSTLSGFPIDFLPITSTDCAEIVLMETGRIDESTRIKDMRLRCPQIFIFGVGRPKEPELFDFIVDVPLEAAKLKSRISEFLEQ